MKGGLCGSRKKGFRHCIERRGAEKGGGYNTCLSKMGEKTKGREGGNRARCHAASIAEDNKESAISSFKGKQKEKHRDRNVWAARPAEKKDHQFPCAREKGAKSQPAMMKILCGLAERG